MDVLEIGCGTGSTALVKPVSVFVSNTACLKDTKFWLRPVATVARLFHLAPFVKFLSREELKNHRQEAGFDILHTWVHENASDVLFVIATRPVDLQPHPSARHNPLRALPASDSQTTYY
ncbi:MAG: hypothetical protein R6W86_09150 [Marinobacter sp.]|uniref:hypothetical protein n=1 Tax=Marinobacter sp. TaxID=50741 RepID=UPI00396E99B7